VSLEVAETYLGPTFNFVSQPYSLTFFTNRPPTLLEQLANGLHLVQNLAGQFAEKAGLIIQAITTDPATFLRNLLTGLKTAVQEVFENLTQTDLLRSKLYTWLVGPISGMRRSASSTSAISTTSRSSSWSMRG
jgi:hypothetical protein